MQAADWLVNERGERHPLEPLSSPDAGDKPYRLYRFLTDLETILWEIPEDSQRLPEIARCLRQLLDSSPWLQTYYSEPSPNPGWSILSLYDEPEFTLTIQIVAWLPGNVSPIHNHGSWGVVALLSGEEKNIFWRRSPTPEFEDRIEAVDSYILTPGEIITFLPDAIHSVEPLGNEAAITLNIYGETKVDKRFEFDSVNHTAWNF
ncbi:MAG: cupin [Roseofilum sp. SBFL]|uniref:cysteine dioxygenase family protein n=1 Tax=unclassified Roseofilum TaxID=2620099 RepID=UPI001B1BB27A|nr:MULTISPECIES: cupin [unclassified Roseofilum]MBP0011675.1 cupin [Roseofilum sp. SID3]MBP0025678.1 cupin [Roseofilum sp. SID2]MBP0040021.1 cupin [Roseofilum sp. SID1]MBP0044684.1 cupin [Roseofilum sp. SBFL]